jgi:glutathione synthase/RimK-type ligase-like ATP-grasp enzyme
MILILSSPSDVHAAAVLEALKRQGASATLLDLSQFPQHLKLSMAYGSGNARRFTLELANGNSLDLSECRVVWWRRPQPFVLHPELTQPTHRQFALSESHEAFAGLWQALDAVWVNHPSKDEVAHRKAYQLKVAQAVGFTIPKTLVSNDPTAVTDFIRALGQGNVIFKAFSATEQEWRETRLLKAEEQALLENVKYAPVIFQEYIEAVYDLRITVVGNDIFPAAIHSQETTYKVDFRMDIAHARIEKVTIPSDVNIKILELMKRLGLRYGAIDMRLSPKGHYVFLEINPAGQWLFIEERSGQPITSHVAHLLSVLDNPV